MSHEPSFQMWGRPGPNANAEIHVTNTGERVLSLFLDPVSLVVQVPPFPSGPVVTARLYRQMARVCAQLATELDPGSGSTYPSSFPQGRARHRSEGDLS
jgi:hypothetical protein